MGPEEKTASLQLQGNFTARGIIWSQGKLLYLGPATTFPEQDQRPEKSRFEKAMVGIGANRS
jgi:hypothetical protein